MEFVKKHWLKIVIGIIILLAIYYFLRRTGKVGTLSNCAGWDKNGKCNCKKGEPCSKPGNAGESSFDQNLMIIGDQSSFYKSGNCDIRFKFRQVYSKGDQYYAKYVSTVKLPKNIDGTINIPVSKIEAKNLSENCL